MTDLTSLLPKHKSSLTIIHNDHLNTYETVECYLSAFGDFNEHEWYSQSEYDTAIETNELWEIHWYPDTPIGSYKVYGSTLENAIRYANSI